MQGAVGGAVTLMDRAYRWLSITWLGSGSSVGSHWQRDEELVCYSLFFPTGEVRGAVATHRDARVLVEKHLQQVRRQEGRMFELLLSSDHVGVLLVRTGRGAGQVWWEKKKQHRSAFTPASPALDRDIMTNRGRTKTQPQRV